MKGSIDRYITGAEVLIVQIFLVVIVVCVFFAAVLRSVGYPIVWSVDIAQLLFAWVSFLGADLALQHGRHIGMDILMRRFPPAVQKGIVAGSRILALAFLGLAGAYGLYLSIINFDRQFSGLEISFSWATLSAPVGCGLMIRTLVKQLLTGREVVQ
ncbi:TRAP transporter small permease [Spirochaeta thermophila]|uniref:Transporter n=1 Tax=Winmispira thermophila (strain ATCC 49972 / DSM 6192 / RI 19.B1) TaxID=665571 RepID=E0RQX3_WINT6|nr:TRAP transporter small permease [Spirochaeta thermophila]ADN03029.1 transporter [Spirochaeta thermophila DSM 6192]